MSLRRCARRLTALLVFLVMAAGARGTLRASPILALAGDVPPVTVQPVPAPTIETFPAGTPPTTPPLEAGENADTAFATGVSGGAYQFSFDGTTLTVTSVDEVTVSGQTTIRLPDNADDQLKGHENGHADLSKDEYDRTAKKKVEDAFRGFKGMKFTGEGATPAARLESAAKKADAERDKRLKNATKAINDQVNTLNKKFDDLTKHGTSPTVTTDKGKEEARKERDRANKAGAQLFTPDQHNGLAQVTGGVVTHDPLTNLLTFDFANAAVTFTSGGAADPILGASLTLQSIQLIGLQENGTMHLATSELTLSQSGMPVLHGYLWELAYFPVSPATGFAGVIQGYLDVPPAFTDAGINNAIGSPFLGQYQGVTDDPVLVARSTFWFYTAEPLFDSSGNALSSRSAGSAIVGVAVPEPASLGLVAFGLGVLALRRRSLRTRASGSR